MNIKYTSDLHLEFDPPYSEFSELAGDVLILAGDIVDGKLKGLDILNRICSKFNHVIMVMGNHEHYKGLFGNTYNKLKDNLPSNVHLLEKESIVINNQRFLGASLWSWMDSLDAYFASLKMNDYKSVKINKNGVYRKLNPEDTIKDHRQTALWLEETIREGDIVVTHHAPSFKSCNPDYSGNTAYATDLSDIMIENKPAYWIHGHIHDPVDYSIDKTIVTSNPYGYYGSNSNFQIKEIII